MPVLDVFNENSNTLYQLDTFCTLVASPAGAATQAR